MVHDVASPSRIRALLLSLLLAGLPLSGCGNDAPQKTGVDADSAMTAKTCSFNCRDLNQCRLRCEADAACNQECDSFASSEAKATYATAKACLDAHGCKDDDCAAQHCAAPVAACLPPVPSIEPAKSCAPTCIHIILCLFQCHDDPTCRLSCTDTAVPTAKKDYDAATACAKAQGCKDLTAEGCDPTPCLDLFDRCQIPTP
jgi:hypothetical protein